VCCDDLAEPQAELPAPVRVMLDRYRAEAAGAPAGRGMDPSWRLGIPPALLRELPIEEAMAQQVEGQAAGEAVDWAGRLAAAVASGSPPPGVVVVDADGVIEQAPAMWVIDGSPRTWWVLSLPPGGQAHVEPMEVNEASPVVSVMLDGVRHQVGPLVERVGRARLRLRSGSCTRWSVEDARGGAWFPADALPKRDSRGRPFFHAAEAELDVPAVELVITAGRGMEFEVVEQSVVMSEGDERTVECEPGRVYDAAARGWYGGDLHVHMNYNGSLVCAPADARRMQAGEALHVMQLVAANEGTPEIWDREAFDAFGGREVGVGGRVTRFGIEYRNHLLGHIHGFGIRERPEQCSSGLGGEGGEDWPPNSVACAEMRALGATVAYTHPAFRPFHDGTPAAMLTKELCRLPAARELVADAVLGLVDAVDVLSLGDHDAAAFLYHRLLGAGLRLAATAGSDTMLSHANAGAFSNPPGWVRVYADLQGAPLSAEAWQAAVAAGRTFATNGPWVELSVDGAGPGAVLDLKGPGTVGVTALAVGRGLEAVDVVGPHGVVATAASVDGRTAELRQVVDVVEPGWLAVVARGGPHPLAAGRRLFAHSTPVYIDVDGRSCLRPDDVAWCVDFLDRFAALVVEVGIFTDDAHRTETLDVLAQAREAYRALSG
jgi:hypothetical protein